MRFSKANIRPATLEPILHIENPSFLMPLPKIYSISRFQSDSIDAQIVIKFIFVLAISLDDHVASSRLPHSLQLPRSTLSARPLVYVDFFLEPLPAHCEGATAAVFAIVPADFSSIGAVVAKLFDCRRRREDKVVGYRNGSHVEECHFLTNSAVTLVDANRFGTGFVDGREGEPDLVFHFAAMAAAVMDLGGRYCVRDA